MGTNGSGLKRIAFIGNYLPRQCGIATFTTDLCESMAQQYPEVNCFAIPVNDTEEGYDYPPRVRFELQENDITSYRRAADFLNINNVDLVCLQHEYGIFGGPAGSHILALLRELRMPIVTTLHTILRDPTPNQRKVLEEIARLSDRLVVMSQRSVEFLQDIYHIPREKIDLIPHGIPDVPFVDPNFYKDQFGVEGKTVLLTFGLLSPNKGIENVIKALPAVLMKYPDVVYIVLGATHPHVKRHEGETYRLSLHRLARALGVEKNVIFHNRFVSLEELIEFIGATDIYITPYLSREQIVSGTLAYTVGAGKAVISTPYWYAEELLADGRGLLVPFQDPEAITEQILYLLDNEAERHAMRKRAYLFGREMIWPTVAQRYMASFERAREERTRSPRPAFVARTLDKQPGELPLLKLDHLRRLTDDTGILQHAIFTVPNYTEGYTTDDNARALVVATLLEEIGETIPKDVENLVPRYLAFLWYAFNPEVGRFRNFMSYDRRWLEEIGSEDSHGRALWGLGTALRRSRQEGLKSLTGRLFNLALSAANSFTSPRAWAFTLIGIHEYLKQFSGDRAALSIRETLAERLMELYRTHNAPGWRWFEDKLTYCNAKLPHALLLCGHEMGRDDMVSAGLEALQWLATIQKSEKGYFVPIGNDGFYPRDGERARFDQQPVEAYAMVSACLAAYHVTGDEMWYQEAQRAFEWFLGRNDLGLPIYDPVTGGCRDGLHPDRVNQNEGAESTLAFLLSLLEMRRAEHVIRDTS
ncbi:MAG: glycosyltransferase family 4 protein [Anaerolineae bacterium]|nr:glycosyltransferase family 4 protein [Anaerolineae bacterium]